MGVDLFANLCDKGFIKLIPLGQDVYHKVNVLNGKMLVWI